MGTNFSQLWHALDEKVISGWVPGLVAGVRHQGHTEYWATGLRTAGQRAPMRTDTPFRIASLSKPLAGAIAASMIADGTLALDDPVDIWLPELAFPHVLTQPDAPLDSTVATDHEVTVRHLLTLTHGLGVSFDDTPLARATFAAGLLPGARPLAMDPQEYLHRMAALPLAYQPGTRWSYHIGSDILSILLARAAQLPLQEVLAERITGPLEMTSTAFFADAAELPTAYESTTAGLAVFDEPHGLFSQPPAFESLGGGLVSTVPDYLKFLSALADDTLLPANLRAEMTKDQLTREQKLGLVGMMDPGASWGWQVSVEADGRFGWSGGSGTTAYVDPAQDLIAVLFTQRNMGGPEDDFNYFWEPLTQALK